MKLKILSIIFAVFTINASNIIEKDFSEAFNDHKGTLVIYDNQKDEYTVYNKDRINKRYSTFSTYKIPHSLIALETGVIENIETEYEWDTKKYPEQDWWPKEWYGGKHNMKNAIKYSVVPFFKMVASKIKSKRMSKYISDFDYGNMDISSGIEGFWLNGSLKISTMEQIKFLKKINDYNLNIKKSNVNQVKDALLQDCKNEYKLYAKTGTGYRMEEKKKIGVIGWLVGFFEVNKKQYYFAYNVEANDFSEVGKVRNAIKASIVSHLNLK